MTPRQRLAAFRLDDDTRTALEEAAADQDRPVSYLIRQAIREWLQRHGYVKTERKRGATRPRS